MSPNDADGIAHAYLSKNLGSLRYYIRLLLYEIINISLQFSPGYNMDRTVF